MTDDSGEAEGIRSSLATTLLRAGGYEVANMRGGYTAWKNAGLPVERPEERTA